MKKGHGGGSSDKGYPLSQTLYLVFNSMFSESTSLDTMLLMLF